MSIFSVLLVAIFMIPAAGFYYTRHSCSSSGEVEYVLDQDYSCCAENIQDHCTIDQPVEKSCCGETSPTEPVKAPVSLEETKEECCSNEGNYLKTEEKYTSPEKSESLPIEIQHTIVFHFYIPTPATNPLIEENAHSPPLIISSKILLLRHGVMLI